MGKIKVWVDKKLCIGSGACVEVAPEVFELDERQKAFVKDPNGADNDTIIEAARSCPTDAIFVVDEETGEQIWPEK